MVPFHQCATLPPTASCSGTDDRKIQEEAKGKCRRRLPSGFADLSLPHGVDSVSNDRGASLLSVVGELGEAGPLPRMYGHL